MRSALLEYLWMRAQGAYERRLTAATLVLAGSFLVGEHVYTSGVDLTLVSHEWYGLGLILFGLLVAPKKPK